MRRLLLWLSHGPYSTSHTSEAVRLGAMASAFDVEVQLVFIGEGVRNVVADQEPYRLGPPPEKLFGPLLAPERPALVDRASLEARHLDAARLARAVPLAVVDAERIADAVRASDWVVPL